MTSLSEFDRMYCDYNQVERADNVILKERGHPDAREYCILRNFFDSLTHFANSSARFYSFENDKENTEYWTPELGLRGRIYVGGRDICPCGGESYLEVLKEVSITEDRAYFSAGSWVITTQNAEFFDAIGELEGMKDIKIDLKSVPLGDPRASSFQRTYRTSKSCYSTTIYLNNLEQFKAVKEVIDRYVEPLARGDGYEAREQVLEARKRSGEPKPIYYANIREVTEKKHSVLIPLIPLGYGWTDLFAATIVYDLHKLGYSAKTIKCYSSLARRNSIKSIVKYVEEHGRFTPKCLNGVKSTRG